MWQMIILADGEHAKVDEFVDEKYACVCDPTPVTITVLNNLPKNHKERKRSKNWDQPKHKVIDGRPGIYSEMQNRKRSKGCGYITKSHNG
jgi:hypothetical protein